MNMSEKIRETLLTIFNKIGVAPNIRIEETQTEVFAYMEGDNLNFMIGYHGESLNALQHMVNLLHFGDLEEGKRVILDINGYRAGRFEKIEEMAKRYIDRVRFFKQEVEMPPMPAHERRHIHLFVSGYNDVLSESTGDGRDRRIVIKPSVK